jgi:putative nucleotidyltransferase with HDIG domain
MGHVPTLDEAYEILKKYNREPFHLEHARTVAKVLASYARRHDPERVDYWRAVGLLHDIDFELYPEQHCVKAAELLREEGVDEGLIRSVVSHGYGICSDVEPELYMEKTLYAVDELTGLIGASALMRPSGLSDMEPKSVLKKFKDRKFAAGCSREVIARGAEMMGIELGELIAGTLEAMKE